MVGTRFSHSNPLPKNRLGKISKYRWLILHRIGFVFLNRRLGSTDISGYEIY